MIAEVEKWGLFEAAFAGPERRQSVRRCDARRRSSLRQPPQSPAPGFYDGDGVYRVRFMPDAEGEWTYPDAFERRKRSMA